MMVRLSRICLSVFLGVGLAGAQVSPPRAPENLKPPGTETVLLRALGRGRQIYSCRANPDNEAKVEWILEEPQADLLDEAGKEIGKHYEGPTWEATDGSKVIGEVQQRAKAPRSDAVPWLLLKAKDTRGSGTFGRVTYIQRVDTVGGVAPDGGCDKSHAGKEVAIDYQAVYYFYASRP
jgi:hypothetical protein